jgi:hypothetical protein
VKAASEHVERGAKKIPDGKIGDSVTETAKGIGNTVSEGAKYSGEQLKEAGQAAEPPAATAWGNARDSAVSFGHSVKGFFYEPLLEVMFSSVMSRHRNAVTEEVS